MGNGIHGTTEYGAKPGAGGDANAVLLTGDQIIAGVKTFADVLTLTGGNAGGLPALQFQGAGANHGLHMDNAAGSSVLLTAGNLSLADGASSLALSTTGLTSSGSFLLDAGGGTIVPSGRTLGLSPGAAIVNPGAGGDILRIIGSKSWELGAGNGFTILSQSDGVLTAALGTVFDFTSANHVSASTLLVGSNGKVAADGPSVLIEGTASLLLVSGGSLTFDSPNPVASLNGYSTGTGKGLVHDQNGDNTGLVFTGGKSFELRSDGTIVLRAGAGQLGFFGVAPASRQVANDVTPASVTLQQLATEYNTLVAGLRTLGLFDV